MDARAVIAELWIRRGRAAGPDAPVASSGAEPPRRGFGGMYYGGVMRLVLGRLADFPLDTPTPVKAEGHT